MLSAFGIEHGEITKAKTSLRRETIVTSQAADRDISAGAPEMRAWVNRSRVSGPGLDDALREMSRRSVGQSRFERASGAYQTKDHHFGPRETHGAYRTSRYIPMAKRPRVRVAVAVGAAGVAAGGTEAVRRRKGKS